VIHLTTVHPFRLPDALVARLPPPASDGQRYIDVRVRGAWDGILVVDPAGDCVGIHVRRRVEALPIQLPFEPSQIEDVRAASLWNRSLAAFPFDFFIASLVMAFVVSPVLLVLSRVVLAPFAGVSAMASLLALFCLVLSSAYHLIRQFVALACLAQAAVGASWFLEWVCR
jgi:hypothetical protein